MGHLSQKPAGASRRGASFPSRLPTSLYARGRRQFPGFGGCSDCISRTFPRRSLSSLHRRPRLFVQLFSTPGGTWAGQGPAPDVGGPMIFLYSLLLVLIGSVRLLV